MRLLVVGGGAGNATLLVIMMIIQKAKAGRRQRTERMCRVVACRLESSTRKHEQQPVCREGKEKGRGGEGEKDKKPTGREVIGL